MVKRHSSMKGHCVQSTVVRLITEYSKYLTLAL